MKRGRYFNRGRKSRPQDPHTETRAEEGSSSEWGRDQDQGSSSGRGFRHERGGSGGSWTTAEPRHGRGGRGGGRDRPPPGLRGKEIGLFYRNQTLERYKQQKGDIVGREKPEFVMALRLPASVIKRVEKLLYTIFEKRKDELCLQGVFKCPENYMQKRDPFEEYTSSAMSSRGGSETGEYDDPETPNTSMLVVESDEGDSNEAVTSAAPDFIPFNIDDSPVIDNPTDSTGGLINSSTDNIEHSDDDCVLLETETAIVHIDDDDGIKSKTTNVILKIDPDDDDCYIYEPPPYTGPRLFSFYTEKTSRKSIKFVPVVKQEPVVLPVIETPDFIPLGSNSAKRGRPNKMRTAQKRAHSINPERWTRLENVIEPQHQSSPEKQEMKSESTISVADLNSAKRYKPLPLRQEGQQYKYGYQDIITGSFMEKLDECLTKGITIREKSSDLDKLSEDYYNDYITKINTTKYKEMLKFRERLPAYKKRKELLDEINNNQVVVISGETGCGKSTQVPQIILDEAIRSKRGANVKILVTQPRRIAASSLAARVSEERSENLGESIGYVVRLERKDARPRGSVTYCTTGVLLADLEVDQGVSGVSHIVLDEVHERDATVDLAMCMLKQVISKRKDLKLILMSATLDAESLSNYFDGCATMHIEGLAYPVTDVYMEEILQLTGYTLPPLGEKQGRHGRFPHRRQTEEAEKDMQYKREMGPMLEKHRSKLGDQVYKTLLDRRIEDLNVDLIFDLIRVICKKEPGAILVFVPGLADITKVMGMMEKSIEFPREQFNIYPLHSKLPSLEQKRIFDRPPHGVRKIVVATNIAETSITIDDVVYVIDSAKIKVTGLSVADNISTLTVEWVSQANLRQRRGRAGRVQPGVCYHLITSQRAELLPARLRPELQRSSLLEPVLTVKRLRLGRAAAALAAAPAPPAPDTLAAAILHLTRLGALDENETLTPLGWHLARLPVHPAAGKLLLLGSLFGCLDRAASVAACWGFKDPFVMVIGKEKEADAAKSRLAIGEPSDHVAISEAIRQWEKLSRGRSDFAWDNFLSSSTLQLLCDMKRQFADNLKSMGFLPSGNIKSHWENRNTDNLSIFKAVVAAALYPQIGTVRWAGLHRPNPRIMVRTPEDGRVDIHPSSALSMPSYRGGGGGGGAGKRICSTPGANWHVYWLKQKTSKLFLFDLTLVHTMPLLFFGELNITDVEKEPSECYINISSIKVRCNKTTARLLVQLRNLLDEVLAARVAAPGALVQHGDFEENVLKVLKVRCNKTTARLLVQLRNLLDEVLAARVAVPGALVQHGDFEENVVNAVIELITAEDEQTSYFEGDGDESDQSDSMVN